MKGYCDASDYKVIKMVEEMLHEGLRRKASEIRVEPLDEARGIGVSYCEVGSFVDGTSLPWASRRAVSARLKILANLDITEWKRPQKGALKFEHESEARSVGVEILPRDEGRESLRLLLLPVSFERFLAAAEAGDVQAVESALGQGQNVNANDHSGYTALHIASGGGHLSIANLLLDHGADIEAKDNSLGLTPLMDAVISYRGGVAIVRLLASRGADINARCRIGHTALKWALVKQKWQCVDLLFELGADLAWPWRHDDLVKTWLEKGVEGKRLSTALIDLDGCCHHRRVVGRVEPPLESLPPCGCSRPRECVEAARLLIEHGADVNARNDQGWTALMTAAAYGCRDMAAFLVEQGADVSAKNSKGQTAADIARARADRPHNGVKEK